MAETTRGKQETVGFRASWGVLRGGIDRQPRLSNGSPTMTTIPESHLDLVTNKPAFANLATVMPDGTPQVTPVWVDFDGSHLLINTAAGRLKDINMQARAQVGVSISDPDNPYRYMGIQGAVTERVEAGADEHIDRMALKYMGKAKYPFRADGEVRVIYRIQPTKVHVKG